LIPLLPKGLLNDYTIPEDQLVIRGVAKRAGVQGYEDAKISISFIEKIQKAIKKKAADEVEQKKIDEALLKQEAIVETEKRLKEVEEKYIQLDQDHDEAKAEFDAATTPADKKRTKLKVDGIAEEIQAAEKLQLSLSENLQKLKA
jgi:hypothetical protein